MKNRLESSSQSALILGALGVVYGDIGTSPLVCHEDGLDLTNGLALNLANLIASSR